MLFCSVDAGMAYQQVLFQAFDLYILQCSKQILFE